MPASGTEILIWYFCPGSDRDDAVRYQVTHTRERNYGWRPGEYQFQWRNRGGSCVQLINELLWIVLSFCWSLCMKHWYRNYNNSENALIFKGRFISAGQSKNFIYTQESRHGSWVTWVNTLRPRQNGHHFADDISECIFLNGNVWILINISLKLCY